MSEYTDIKRILEHKAEEYKLQEKLKDLDAQRTEWERKSALFVPSKQRLEKGGKTLEVGEDYEAIKDLRIMRDKYKLQQSSLKNEMTRARTDLHNADEALNLIEGEYRVKLTEQTTLQNTVQKVKVLDEQIRDRRAAAIEARKDYEKTEKEHKECAAKVENEKISLEKIELSLRETRKFLQTHSVDEKLQASLAGIQKCFTMYEQAEQKRISVKNMWSGSIQERQKAQNSLNDRAKLFSDVNHKYEVLEKNFVRSRAFYESTLKGKSISEWREICDKSTKKLSELDELYKKFQNVKSLEERLKDFQEQKLRIQQETKNLNILDVEHSKKIHELNEDAKKLERRVELLNKIENLDAVRELLQENIPCPLCGSTKHPYISGNVIPDPDELQRELSRTQKALEELNSEVSKRNNRTSELSAKMSDISSEESDLRKKIGLIKAEIASNISLMGLKFTEGIPPFEEIDRERQKTRDILQMAEINASTAEAAQQEMKAAGDELEKIRETRSEVTKYHQNSLFELQNSKSEEEQLQTESKTQDEIVNSLKRELISQIMPYGYKVLPDKNPDEVVKTLEKRMNEWLKNSKRSVELERELSALNTKITNLKKERENLKLKCEDFNSRVKAVEAERDSVQQQRIILFASKVPDDEISRVNKDVENLKTKLNERREAKNKFSRKLDEILTELHSLETDMAKSREKLQRHEINFNKKLLNLGFKSEDDYAAACLTTEERRVLQNRLRELTQEDLELKSERENVRAKILELQSEKINLSNDEIVIRVKALKNSLEPEEAAELRKLMLKCALPEVI